MSAAALIALAILGAPDLTVTSTAAEATESDESFFLAERPRKHRLIIFPTVGLSRDESPNALGERVLRAFSNSFEAVASEIFAWRRWELVSEREREGALEVASARRGCRSNACIERVSAALKVTHWITSAIVPAGKDRCRMRVRLFNFAEKKLVRIIDDEIQPCSTDNVLGRAEDLGRRLAEGPRAPESVDLALTPRSIPSIDIPDVPDLTMLGTSTVARTSKIPLDEALEKYEQRHLISFEDERGRFFVARGNKLLNDCQVMRLAKRRVTPEATRHCEGNFWELAWLGAPVGGLIALGGLGADSLPSAGLVVGLAVLAASPLVALVLNVDAAEPRRGDHLLTREELEELIGEANAAERKELSLTEADVDVAGMRR